MFNYILRANETPTLRKQFPDRGGLHFGEICATMHRTEVGEEPLLIDLIGDN